MKLSLQLILETLTEYGAQLIETDGDFAFTGVQILTSPTDILEPDTLYVCTPKVLPKLKKQLFENHCFVFKAKPSQLQCHHALHGILLDENTDLNEVVNRLITLFTQFHAFEFAIKEASLERRGYEPFFEIAKKAFPHCLIVVTDSAYNIVCSTRSSVDDIPYFRDLLQRGYYSREDMNQIASWGYYEDERKCVQPVLYPAEKTICGYPFLVRSYKNHGAAYCFIGCYFLDVPPTQRDISLYTCLTQELENYYKVNGIFDAGMLGKQRHLPHSEDPGHPRAGSRRSGCPSAADDLVQDPRNDRPHPALGNAARRERYRQQRHRASRVTTVSRPLSPEAGENGRFFSSFLHSRLCGGGKKRRFE